MFGGAAHLEIGCSSVVVDPPTGARATLAKAKERQQRASPTAPSVFAYRLERVVEHLSLTNVDTLLDEAAREALRFQTGSEGAGGAAALIAAPLPTEAGWTVGVGGRNPTDGRKGGHRTTPSESFAFAHFHLLCVAAEANLTSYIPSGANASLKASLTLTLPRGNSIVDCTTKDRVIQ